MRKIIIAPYAFHKGLISFLQKNDPFYDAKLITKEDVLASYYGKLSHDAIAELLAKEELDINKIKEISKYIPFAVNDSDNLKIHSLCLYNKDLKEKGFVKENEYFPCLIKDKEVVIIGYSKDDFELTNILDNLKAEYRFDYGHDKVIAHDVTKYKSLLLESLDLLNSLAREINNGKRPNDIYVYTNNKDLISYLKQFHNSFNVPINFNDSIQFSLTELGKDLLQFIDDCDSVEQLIEHIDGSTNNPYKADLIKLINDNSYDFLNLEKQKELLKSAIESFAIKSEKYDNAVRIISSPIYVENSTIFVPGFVQGAFPNVYKDNEYISDNEKLILGLNTSDISTKISYWDNMEFFDSNNEFFFSYSTEHLSNSYSISPIAIFNNYKVISNKCPNLIFSDEYRVYLQTISIDLFNVFKEKTSEYKAFKDFELDYKNYDNSYTYVKHFTDKDKLKHSYTSIGEFYECPFKYYLDYVLHVNKDDYGLAATIGTICHDVFQHMFDHEFDFDSYFENSKNSHELNALELLIIDALKGQVKKAVEIFLLHKNNYMTESYVLPETNAKVDLDENTKLIGRIDAGYIVNKEYAVIIDYKSGSDKVDIKNIDYGVSLQLPIYAYLSRNDKRFSDFKIGGLYLQKFIEKSYSYEIKDDAFFKSVLKLDGLSNKEIDFLNKFDFSFRDNGKSQFINGVSLKKDGSLSSSSKLLTENELNELANKAEQLVRDADRRIRENNFDIFPLKIKNSKDACQYCKNKDICYVRSKQFNTIETKETE